MLSLSPTSISNTMTSPWTCTPSRLVLSLPTLEATLNPEEILLKARTSTLQSTGVTSFSLLLSYLTLTTLSISKPHKSKAWSSKVSLKVKQLSMNKSLTQLSQLEITKLTHCLTALEEHSWKLMRAYSARPAFLLTSKKQFLPEKELIQNTKFFYIFDKGILCECERIPFYEINNKIKRPEKSPTLLFSLSLSSKFCLKTYFVLSSPSLNWTFGINRPSMTSNLSSKF